MTTARTPKKNVTLEIRLPDRMKSAFARQCRLENRTASEALREMIEQRLSARAAPRRLSPWRVVAAALIGLGLGAGMAVPTLARSVIEPAPGFDQLDRNHDGVLSRTEFCARHGAQACQDTVSPLS